MHPSSHRRALAATKAGKFENEIVPCAGKTKVGEEVVLSVDEGIRPGTTAAKLAKLRTLRKGEGGVITAGTASQITDGASAMLICNEAGLRKLGLEPRAKIVCQTVVGSDPIMMLYGPIPVGAAGGEACACVFACVRAPSPCVRAVWRACACCLGSH